MGPRDTALSLALFFSSLGAFGMMAAMSGWFAAGGVIERFQTLIAGAFALIAAVVGWRAIMKQIAASEVQEEERRKRRLAACRAVLPLALSNMAAYAGNRIEVLRLMLLQQRDGMIPASADVRMDEPPGDVIAQLKEFVEVAEPLHGNQVAILLSRIQVHEARMREFRRHVSAGKITKATVEYNILDVAEIYSRTVDLLTHARGGATVVDGDEISSQALVMALLFNHCEAEHFPELFERVHSRHKP